MKLQNVALALGIAGLSLLQQVTAARAALIWNFSFSSPTDNVSGILTTTGVSYKDKTPYTITSIKGTINGSKISSLDNSNFDYTSQIGNGSPANQLIEWDGKNGFLVNLTGIGFDGGGLRYNAYSNKSISDSDFETLDSVAAFNGSTLTRNNYPGNTPYNGIVSSLTPVPEPDQGALAIGLPLLLGLRILKKCKVTKVS